MLERMAVLFNRVYLVFQTGPINYTSYSLRILEHIISKKLVLGRFFQAIHFIKCFFLFSLSLNEMACSSHELFERKK